MRIQRAFINNDQKKYQDLYPMICLLFKQQFEVSYKVLKVFPPSKQCLWRQHMVARAPAYGNAQAPVYGFAQGYRFTHLLVGWSC